MFSFDRSWDALSIRTQFTLQNNLYSGRAGWRGQAGVWAPASKLISLWPIWPQRPSRPTQPIWAQTSHSAPGHRGGTTADYDHFQQTPKPFSPTCLQKWKNWIWFLDSSWCLEWDSVLLSSHEKAVVSTGSFIKMKWETTRFFISFFIARNRGQKFVPSQKMWCPSNVHFQWE